jgi:hypothetical protein
MKLRRYIVSLFIIATLLLQVATPLQAAPRTDTIAAFANGLVRVEIDWNDSNGQITKGRCVNNSDFAAKIIITLSPPVNGFSLIEADCPAHQTFEQNTPNNTVKMTQVLECGELEWKLIGITLGARWPA